MKKKVENNCKLCVIIIFIFSFMSELCMAVREMIIIMLCVYTFSITRGKICALKRAEYRNFSL